LELTSSAIQKEVEGHDMLTTEFGGPAPITVHDWPSKTATTSPTPMQEEDDWQNAEPRLMPGSGLSLHEVPSKKYALYPLTPRQEVAVTQDTEPSGAYFDPTVTGAPQDPSW
jgi:hypothetical protein